MYLKSFYIIRFNNYSCFKPSLLKQTNSKLRIKDLYCEAVCLSSQSWLSLYYTITSLMFFSLLEQNWALVCVRPKLHLLPDWPDTQATALGHVCQILLCFSHVLVDGVHSFLNSLQLLCEEQGCFWWRVMKATYWQRPLMLTAWQSCVFILR